MVANAQHADWGALQDLFPKYLDGNPLATEKLFKSIQKAVLGYYLARMHNKNEAEDLSQAALLKIHFARDRYDAAQSLKTWVFTIASRTLIDHWRGLAQETKHQDQADPEESMASLEAETLSPELKTELSGDLNQALLTLKPIDRSIVYLSGVEGLSMAEIANIQGMTEAAVKVRVHRANHALRKLLVLLIGALSAWGVYGHH